MQLILVSGLSGSGKSIALDVLEDAGFYCIDNLPASLLGDTLAFVSGAGHERIAVAVDARSAALASLTERVAALKSSGVDCRLLFLEATAPTLLRRYSETRRRHPLAGAGLTLAEAIEQERTVLAGVADLGHRIDTSGLQPKALRGWIRDLLGLSAGGLTLLFESFAYRDGIPLDADWVIDSRMLPNPYYEPGMRALTKLSFRVLFRRACLKVTITHSSAHYELLHDGDPLTVRHEEEVVTVRNGEPVTRGWTVPDPGPEPRQPPGRAPTRRRPR